MGEKVKILRIIARLNIGGPARNAVLLTEGLSDSFVSRETCNAPRRYETVLICGEVGSHEGDMMYLVREKGIKPIIIKELAREISWKDDFAAFWKIYKIICREKPDIIHTHTAKAGALGRLAGIIYRLFRRPDKNVWTLRNDDSTCHCEAVGRSNLKRPIIIHTFHGHVFHGYFGKLKTIFFIWVERFLALFTDRIITVSGALKKELVEKYRIAPERKFSVVELGFELDELFKLPLRENSRTVNIGIVGRLVPVKNHKMLLRVIKKLKAYSLQLKAVIIGDGEMREKLGRYAGELGIEDMVEFSGWVKNLKAIYEGLDIVVLTSLNEGTPVSLIEAMAGARPVVATNVGGMPDIVRDGVNGYLVESGDIEAFSEKLSELIKNPEKRMTFGQNGRDIVKLRFSKERLIKDTEKLYNNLLDKKGVF